uniref:Glutathione peroxidase n=2 Tax=Lygus hesperus TaxID=30085 RepID=A0A0A9YWS6_LYGHE
MYLWGVTIGAPVTIGIVLYFAFNPFRESKVVPEDPTNSSPVPDMAESNANNVYAFTVKNNKGEDVSLEQYRGKVLLIVNVASLCGLTDTNYKELAELDDQFREAGLRILAFPCNQFGSQEPGTNEEIVCTRNKYKASFDLFDKIDVNGANTHPLYKYLKNAQSGWFGNGIKWNFTKFLVNKEGIPVERHAPTTPPSKLVPQIKKLLEQ